VLDERYDDSYNIKGELFSIVLYEIGEAVLFVR